MNIDNIKKLNDIIKDFAFIAGGVCRSIYLNEEPNDIDIFLKDKKYLENVLEIISKEYGDMISENDNVVNFKDNIQVIKPRKTEYYLSYGKEDDVVSSFDFTICRGYIDENLEIKWIDSEESIESINTKQLKIKNIVCPISSMRRAFKYASKKEKYFMPLSQICILFQEFKNRNIDLSEAIKEFEEVEEFDWYEFFFKNNIDYRSTNVSNERFTSLCR